MADVFCTASLVSNFNPVDTTAALLVGGLPSLGVALLLVAAWVRLHIAGKVHSQLEDMKLKASLLADELDTSSADAVKLSAEVRRKKLELLAIRKDLQVKKRMAQQLTYALEDGGVPHDIIQKLRDNLPDSSEYPEFPIEEEPEPKRAPVVAAKNVVEFSEKLLEGCQIPAPSVHHKEPCMQYLRVRIHEAIVPVFDISGTTDSYVKLTSGLMSVKSSVKMKNLHPIWNEHYILGVMQETEGCQKLKDNLAPESLTVTLCDWDATGDEDIGSVSIPFSEIPGYDDKPVKEPEAKWYNVEVEHSMMNQFVGVFTRDQSSDEGAFKQIWTDIFGGQSVKDGKLIEKESKLATFVSDVFASREELEAKRKKNPVDCRVKLSCWFDPEYKEVYTPPVGTLKFTLEKVVVHGRSSSEPRNPYCVIQYQEHWIRLPTSWHNNKAIYNRILEFAVFEPSSVLTIAVFDEAKDRGMLSKDDFLGKFRVRVSWLRRCVKLESTQPLLVRDGKVKKKGEVKFSLYYDAPSFLPVLLRYLAPPLSDHHYYEPLGDNELPLLRFHQEAIKLYLDTAEPPVHEEAVKELFVDKVPSLEIAVALANVERLKRAISPIISAINWFDDICSWKSIPKSLMVNIAYCFLVLYPEYLASLGAVSLAFVFSKGWFKYMRKWKLPEMDASLFGGTEQEEEESKKKDDDGPGILADNPLTLATKKLEELQMLGGRVQNIIGEVAGLVEKIRNTAIWRDPIISAILTTIFLISAPLIIFLPIVLRPALIVIGLFVMRHPILRDPLPPPPVNIVLRMPSSADLML
eukprot:NODE_457_length_2732_cov_50.932158_g391_i0.p1 GENE.NODE_457_length_2732_cov_50.932158_g391_i0~~NODE_457_length_2732_cov_50.932158_g391_i0.p1  ORF type:complete len:815 (+),score=154.18 NODE_457_length_2732_cov_50.932158_g391_i0:40-2445(+)